ncbi:uncharacterized protein GGS25DRAFT_521264 [Hypoxylon fragiforme]|uniref:uncharacterized protein n=1 Tax=Hypoxylon fragiforme TaxID=63214 RepID=UPI0020C6128C|nr:uncharacterized protein GGS25DRAFT_521264 [Hypoxylon fragiforme]KAI2608097.1 hypothetical protein GGS25DRAFT_521264 [Hypoxylon fragiforme]
MKRSMASTSNAPPAKIVRTGDHSINPAMINPALSSNNTLSQLQQLQLRNEKLLKDNEELRRILKVSMQVGRAEIEGLKGGLARAQADNAKLRKAVVGAQRSSDYWKMLFEVIEKENNVAQSIQIPEQRPTLPKTYIGVADKAQAQQANSVVNQAQQRHFGGVFDQALHLQQINQMPGAQQHTSQQRNMGVLNQAQSEQVNGVIDPVQSRQFNRVDLLQPIMNQPDESQVGTESTPQQIPDALPAKSPQLASETPTLTVAESDPVNNNYSLEQYLENLPSEPDFDFNFNNGHNNTDIDNDNDNDSLFNGIYEEDTTAN